MHSSCSFEISCTPITTKIQSLHYIKKAYFPKGKLPVLEWQKRKTYHLHSRLRSDRLCSCKNPFSPNPPSLPTITHPPTTTTTCLLPCYCAASISFRLRLPNPQHQTPPHPPPLPRWLPPSAVPASSRPGRPLAQHRLRRTVSTVLSVSLNRPYVPLPSCLEYVKRRPERNSRHAR